MVSGTKTALLGEGMTRGRCKLLVAILLSVNLAQAYFLLSYMSDNNAWIEKHNVLEMKLSDMSYKAKKFEDDYVSCHSKEKELEDSNQDLERDVKSAKDSTTKALKELSASNNKYKALHSFYDDVKILLGKSRNEDPSDGDIATFEMLKGILSQVTENATALQRKNGALESDLAAASEKVTALQANFTACKGKMADALQREAFKSNECQEHLKTAEGEVRYLELQLKQTKKDFENRKSLEDSTTENKVPGGHNSKPGHRTGTIAPAKSVIRGSNAPRAGLTSAKHLGKGKPNHPTVSIKKEAEVEATVDSTTESPSLGGGQRDKQVGGLKDVHTDAVDASTEPATENVMSTPAPDSDHHEGVKTENDALTGSDDAGNDEDYDSEGTGTTGQ